MEMEEEKEMKGKEMKGKCEEEEEMEGKQGGRNDGEEKEKMEEGWRLESRGLREEGGGE